MAKKETLESKQVGRCFFGSFTEEWCVWKLLRVDLTSDFNERGSTFQFLKFIV